LIAFALFHFHTPSNLFVFYIRVLCCSTEVLLDGSTYGEMFSVALKVHGQLCIGLYRLHDQASPESNKRYVITNPPSELRLLSSDNVYVLEQFDPGLEYEPTGPM